MYENQNPIQVDTTYRHDQYRNFDLQAHQHCLPNQEIPPIASPDPLPVAHVMPEDFDRDLVTRRFCILSLGLGWCISTTLLVLGIVVVCSKPVAPPPFISGKMVEMGALLYPWIKANKSYLPGHRVCSLPQFAANILPILVNIALTIVFDCINYIPAVFLRWALWDEGRLDFAANPRLLTRTKKHFCSSWYLNIASMAALVIAYGATSIVFYKITIIGLLDNRDHLTDLPFSGPRYGVDFNGWGSIGLGLGLMIQCMISTLCFLSRAKVRTWSSNPLAIARACLTEEYSGKPSASGEVLELPHAHPRFARVATVNSHNSQATSVGFSSTYTSKKPQTIVTEISASSSTSLRSVSIAHGILSLPRPKHEPMKDFRARTYRFVIAIWILFGIFVIGTIVIAVAAYKTDALSRAYMESVANIPNHPTTTDYWESYGQVDGAFCKTSWTQRRDWLALIIQCVELAIVLVGLHCAELLVHLARDEVIWRKSATIGSSPDTGSLIAGIPCIPYWALFIFKVLVPWTFGQGFDSNCLVFASLLPIIVLTFLFLLLAVFAEFTVRRRPSGFQPPTYGNIRTLASLVDEWQHKKIFWGDKGEVADLIRKAGSDGRRMPDLRSECLYMGIRPKQS